MLGHRLSRLQHLRSLDFPSVPLVWGKTVSCKLCAGQSRGTLKREKCCFGSGSAHATKFQNFSRKHPFHLHLHVSEMTYTVSSGTLNSTIPYHSDGLLPSAEFAAIRRLYIQDLGCVTSITKKHSCFGLVWSRSRADRGLSRPTSIFLTIIGVCKILSRSVEIWQNKGQKPVLEQNITAKHSIIANILSSQSFKSRLQIQYHNVTDRQRDKQTDGQN